MRPSAVPRLPGFDHTLAFLRQGYLFISGNCDRLGTDMFCARLMLRQATCMRGAPAARLFYEGDRLTRVGAVPPTTLRLLQDKGSVQQLDGAAHRERKALFLRLLMSDDAEARLLALFREEWFRAIAPTAPSDPIKLLDAASLVLTAAICRWAGLSIDEDRKKKLSRSLKSMVDNAGNPGPGVLTALLRRSATERFLRRFVEDIREEKSETSSPLAIIALHRGDDGRLLSLDEATVEIVNLLRPTVAIARYVVFAALTLHQHPEWRERLRGADQALANGFAEEIRRYQPFFPVVGARARSAFAFEGAAFEKGDWLLLDLYGTNHDPRWFPEPGAFRPERGLDWREGGFEFVPQGGGRAETGHRCPGERFTVAIIREATRLMVDEMTYDVPPQDLSVLLDRFPTGPQSGFVITNARRKT